MIPQEKKLFIAAILFLLIFVSPHTCNADDTLNSVKVFRVIDGDTIEISDGERVRLLGIDTPERGEPLSDLAANRLNELIGAGPVTLELCDERDIYGRLLATVSVDELNINRTMLKEGLALPMLIPPCGRKVAKEVLIAAGKGAGSGKGVYSSAKDRMILNTEALGHIGQYAMVKGRILKLHKGRKAWHFNFGRDYKTDFTAVLFTDGQRRFSELGMDPADLVGSEVLVIGVVKRYNGPEIIVHGPDQIIPLSNN